MSEDDLDTGLGYILNTELPVQVEGTSVAYSYCGGQTFCGEYLLVTCLRVADGETPSGHKLS